MKAQDTRLGIALMSATMFVFAMQDGISRHLGAHYSILMVVMIRYWFFAAFVTAVAARRAGGLAQAAATRFPVLQIARGVVLALNICVATLGFVRLGLVDSLAVMVVYPLIITALSGPVLGERVGWRRWAAVAAGLVGLMVILDPTSGALSLPALLPLAAAGLMAAYALMTRYVARGDSAAVSFFWTGVSGAVAMTLAGVWFLGPMAPADWGWMALLCLTGSLGHWLLIRAYEVAEASAIQPFTYLQLVFGSALGLIVFGDSLRANVAVGSAIVVGAGLFALWREHVTKRPEGRDGG